MHSCTAALQRFFIERAQMDKRIAETAGQAREAETLMSKIKVDAVAQRDAEVRGSRALLARGARGSVGVRAWLRHDGRWQVSRVREAFASESKEEQQRRLAVSAWLQAKYDDERARFDIKYAELRAMRARIEQQSAEVRPGRSSLLSAPTEG
jgi:hypothetical protein